MSHLTTLLFNCHLSSVIIKTIRAIYIFPEILLASSDFFVSLPSVRGGVFCDKVINSKDVMAATVLNEAQLELLRMVSVFNTPEAVTDLKQAISNYFAQKAEEEIDRLWEDGTLTEAKVEGFRSLHERTAYK